MCYLLYCACSFQSPGVKQNLIPPVLTALFGTTECREMTMKAVSHQAQEFGIHFGYLGFWLGEANQYLLQNH